MVTKPNNAFENGLAGNAMLFFTNVLARRTARR